MPDFQLLFESVPGLYLVLLPDDPVFTIVAVSNAYLTATMTERSAILGRGLFQVFPDNPADPNADGVLNLGASLRRVLTNRKADSMAFQKYDVRKAGTDGGEFEERYWSPVNSPVFGEKREIAFVIHRVEDVTDFVHLNEKKLTQDRATADLRLHAKKMEVEVFQRAEQLQAANRQLQEANEQLAALRDRESAASRQALEESERRYRTLVSATSAIVWTRDSEGSFVEPQPSWEQYTGQSFDQYKGWGWLEAIHPDDRDMVRDRWREVVKTGLTFDVETRLWNRALQRYCCIHGRGAAVTAPDGSVQEWIGTVTDIDDRKRLEEQLRHTAKLESLGVLAGGIAHDFNNLLTGILGNASQAVEIFAPKNQADLAILTSIVDAGERAAHLTRQMLAYSGKGSFVIRPVDLSELVRSISALVRSSVPASVYVRLELKDGLPPIQADPGQLQQVVMNLIINGAEAIEDGVGGSVLVTTTTQTVDEQYARNFETTYSLTPGAYVSLEVHDTGSGMTDETKRRIFDPFFTTKVHGRGLGLSAVLGIVRGHKGALRVYSEPGKGTTFKVLFPAGKAEVGSGVGAPATAPARQPDPAASILVIDDQELISRTIQACLVREAYTVVVANDGPAGIELFRANPEAINLVILDLTMPKMSGEETLRHLRAIRPHVPVILSSGYNQVEATRKFVGKGLASFLQKPFTRDQLLSAVRGALNGFSVAKP